MRKDQEAAILALRGTEDDNAVPVQPPVEIRDAQLDDLEDVIVLVSACVASLQGNGIYQWDYAYPGRLTVERDIRAGAAIVATADSGLLGYVVLDEQQNPEYAQIQWVFPGPAAVVHRLMVAPSMEGRGIGRALMSFVEGRAGRLGYSCIRLDAFISNPRALRFYDAVGYRRAGLVHFRKRLFECFEKSLMHPQRASSLLSSHRS